MESHFPNTEPGDEIDFVSSVCSWQESAYVSVLLTFHPHYYDKTLRTGLICQRSPFCPACCHKIASSQTPAGWESFRKAGYEGNGSVHVDLEHLEDLTQQYQYKWAEYFAICGF